MYDALEVYSNVVCAHHLEGLKVKETEEEKKLYLQTNINAKHKGSMHSTVRVQLHR